LIEADVFGLGGVEVASGVGQFAGDSFGNQARQALQGADVGDHADVDFAHREHGIGRGVAHVAAGDEVDRAADAGALDGGEHRLAAALDAAVRQSCMSRISRRSASRLRAPSGWA
jgi:hypothetical protein